jgi:hypothetical protein
MKRTTVVLAAIAGVALMGAIGAAGAVTAHAQTNSLDPTATPQPWEPVGMGPMWGGASGADGPMHDDLIAAFADALGLSTSEVETRLATGETLSSIAQGEGLSLEEFRTLLDQSRQTAVDKAQAEGLVTRERVQAMRQLMDGSGSGPDGLMGANGDCPMAGETGNGGARFGGTGMFGNRGAGGFQSQ